MQHHNTGNISPRSVRKFLERQRDDLSKWKNISDAELDRRESLLPIPAPYWDKMKRHQRITFLLCVKYRSLLILNDTGTGKTFLSLALMTYFERLKITHTNLVLVPNKINKGEWAKQIEKHTPDLTYVLLNGSSETKWRLLEDNRGVDVVIETYMGFVRMVTDLVSVKRGKRTKRVLDVSDKKIKWMQKFIDGIYADESTYLADRMALPYRCTSRIAKGSRVVFPMTATPFGRDPEMVWSQAFLVDGGYTLGETLGLYRQAFYEEKESYWRTERVLKKDSKATISRFLDHVSICFPADEADLPRKNRVPRYAELTADADDYYQRAKEMLMRSRGDTLEMKNSFLRMRQISSGFVGYKDDETGDKAQFVFDENPKLDLLHSVVTEIREDYKFIVFHEFNYSAGVISGMLKDAGINHVLLNGMRRDQDYARHEFETNPKVQALVLSNSAGGYGLNLQNAKFGIYYESPVGAILRKQTEKRFDRQYSLHKTVGIIDLIVRGTVDQSILDFHAEGRSLWKAILNTGASKVLGKAVPRKIERARLAA